MIGEFEQCYRAVQSRDPRFDGWFFTAVTSTGIYCRPSCPAITPKPANVRFFPTAAAAQQHGFRACKRCLPDATPGSPEWNLRADAVARAMRLIADGLVDREGVAGLADRLGYSARHLHRMLVVEVGAGPLALARAQRAQTARILIETTTLPFAQVAFAAGFDSIRQFNDTVRRVLATTPSELRRRAARLAPAARDAITVRLPYRAPCDVAGTLAFLAARAVPGVEAVDADGYHRSLALPHGTAVVTLAPHQADWSGSVPPAASSPASRHQADWSGSVPPAASSPASRRRTGSAQRAAAGFVRCTLRLDDLRDLTAAVQRCRRLLDLDADPQAVDAHLGTDAVLAPLVAAAPGRRVPGAVDGAEMAVRAVLGQQVSTAAARTLAGRLVATCGKPLDAPHAGVTHLFPSADALAGLDDADLPLTTARRRTVRALTTLLAEDDLRLDPGSDREEATAAVLTVPGIGPWTAGYVRMRALADPDAFLPTDLGVRHALTRLGQDGDPRHAEGLAQPWSPWRAYALMHLWSTLDTTSDPPRKG